MARLNMAGTPVSPSSASSAIRAHSGSVGTAGIAVNVAEAVVWSLRGDVEQAALQQAAQLALPLVQHGLQGQVASQAGPGAAGGASVVQHDAEQGVVDLEAAVVVDEPELLEFVHEGVQA